jgi:hypothetical protein
VHVLDGKVAGDKHEALAHSQDGAIIANALDNGRRSRRHSRDPRDEAELPQ